MADARIRAASAKLLTSRSGQVREAGPYPDRGVLADHVEMAGTYEAGVAAEPVTACRSGDREWACWLIRKHVNGRCALLSQIRVDVCAQSDLSRCAPPGCR